MEENNRKINTRREYCNIEHIKDIIAYCNECNNYVCEDCQIASHFNHNMINLESECFKKFSEYKNIAYSIKIMLKQYDKVLSEQSIDESLSSLTSKINNLFNELVNNILAYKEKILKELFESKDIQDIIKERMDAINGSMQVLQELNNDAQNLLKSIQEEFENRRYILIYERNLKEQLKPLQDRLDEWKRLSSMNPLRLQELEQDLCIDTNPSETKLKEFINLTHLSRPHPQSVYMLNEFSNMLLLHNISTGSSSILKINSELRIPFHYSSAILNNKIYFVGGDDDGYRKDCYAVPLEYPVLLVLEDLHVERRGHTVVPFHLKGLLFAVGGYNKTQQALNSVERYDSDEDIWTLMPPMLIKRQWPGACQFNNKLLYCFGGYQTNAIECFDIIKKTWELIELTKKHEDWTGYSACAVIQISPNEILIMGGCNVKDLDKVFVYNHKAKTLVPKSQMPVPSLFSQKVPIVSDSKIGIIGLRNEILYIYETTKDKWTLVDPADYQTTEFTKQ